MSRLKIYVLDSTGDPTSVHSIIYISLIYHSFITPGNVIRVKYHMRMVY